MSVTDLGHFNSKNSFQSAQHMFLHLAIVWLIGNIQHLKEGLALHMVRQWNIMKTEKGGDMSVHTQGNIHTLTHTHTPLTRQSCSQ